MEKKNILKLLALIVLMTVVFCGAAFASTTGTTPAHEWKTTCDHLKVFKGILPNTEDLEFVDYDGNELTFNPSFEKAATCALPGFRYECCDGSNGCTIKHEDGAIVIFMRTLPADGKSHGTNFEKMSDTQTGAGDWNFGDMAANCDHGKYTASYCLDCKNKKPTTITNVVTDRDSHTNGWYKHPTANYYVYVKFVDDGKIDATAHEGVNTSRVITNYAGELIVKEGYYSEDDYNAFSDDDIVSVKIGNCSTRGYYEYYCDVCESNYKIYHNESVRHQLALKKDATAKSVEFEPLTGKFFLNGKTAKFYNEVKDQLLLKETKADCDSGVTEIISCTECSYTKEYSYGEGLGHKWAAKTITKAATCKEAGYTKTISHVCERCGIYGTTEKNYKEDVKTIEAIDHNVNDKNVIFKWFGWEGQTYPMTNNDAKEIAGAGYEGKDASYTGTYIVNEKPVTYTLKYDVTLPVCGVTDGSATVTCTLCEMPARTVIIDKGEHDWDPDGWVERPNYAMDCTIAGEKTEKCSICKVTRKIEVPAELDHDVMIWYEQTITNMNGIKDTHGEYQPYANGEYFKNDHNHYPIEWNENGEIIKEMNSFYGNVLVTDSTKCLYPCIPYTVKVACVNEDCRYGKVETAAALDATKHVFENKPLELPATCTTEGHLLYNCVLCQKTKDVKQPMLPHDWKTTKTVDATCTEDGYIEKTCQKPTCGLVVKQDIAAYGHDLVVTKKAATCYEMGYELTTCNNCDYTKNVDIAVAHVAPKVPENLNASTTIPAGYTKYKAADCNNDGVRSYECVVCGENVEDEVIKKYDHVNPKTGLSWLDTEPVHEEPANCVNGAYDVFQCTECKVYVKKDVATEPKLANHKTVAESAMEVIVPPTCTEDGVGYYKCPCEYKIFKTKNDGKTLVLEDKKCGAEVKNAVIKKLGHEYTSVWNPDTNAWEPVCSRCEVKDNVNADNAKYTASIEGKKLNIKVEDKNAKLYDKVYARVSVGKQIGDVTYAVVYVVEIEWNNGAWGEEGTAVLAQIQGAGTTTGTSVVLTTNVNADELSFADSLKGNIGTLIK